MIKAFGLVGYKGSGKDTLYETLDRAYPNRLHRVALADPLKRVCSEVFNIDLNDFNDRDKKEKPFEKPIFIDEGQVKEIYKLYDISYYHMGYVWKHIGTNLYTPRHVAQYVGTEILRDLDVNIHLKTAVKNMPENKITVITDVRFPNEAEFFRQQLGSLFQLVHITREETDRIAEKDLHESESYVKVIGSSADIHIKNDVGLSEFSFNVLDLIKL